MRLLVAPVASVAFSRQKVGNASDALPKDGSRLAANGISFRYISLHFASFRVTIVPRARGLGWSDFGSITEKEQRKNKERLDKFGHLKKEKRRERIGQIGHLKKRE
jgi:hypothetical protein